MSPISPALFTICIAGTHKAVGGQVEGCRGISSVDDVTRAVEGEKGQPNRSFAKLGIWLNSALTLRESRQRCRN